MFTRLDSRRILVVIGATAIWGGASYADEGATSSHVFRFVDKATRSPLADLLIEVRAARDTQRLRTDANGLLAVAIPVPQPELVRVQTIKPDGYIPLRATWNSRENADPLPTEFAFELEPGHTIGGQVVGPEGDPVEGARIHWSMSGRPKDADSHLDYAIDSSAPIAQTGADGRWQFEGAPKDIDRSWFRVNHDDYLSGTVFDRQPPQAELLAKSVVMELTRGSRIEGRVENSKGKPVEGATVTYIAASDRSSAKTQSYDAGRFVIENAREGSGFVRVDAPDYAVYVARTAVSKVSEPLDIVLAPARTARLKAVDPGGKPVAGANVSLVTLSGLTEYDLQMCGIRMPRQTNDQGEWEWTSAPDGEIGLSLNSEGMFLLQPLRIVADGNRHKATLSGPMRVTGRVLDAVTGEPITDAAVYAVLHWRPIGRFVERSHQVKFSDGAYETQFTRYDADHGLRAEAPGYRAAMTEKFAVRPGDEVVDIRLEPVPDILGVVQDATGNPLAGVDVVLCTPSQQINLSLGRFQQWPDKFSLTSDENGQISLPAQDESYLLIVANERGYAEVRGDDFERDRKIVLEPWASLKGTLWQNGEPLSGTQVLLQPIRINSWETPIVSEWNAITTTQEGTYVFDRVPPRPMLLTAEIGPWRDTKLTSAPRIPIDFAPGDRAEIDLGRGGVRLTGRVAAAGAPQPERDWHWSINYLVRNEPGVPPPPEIADAGFDVADGWNEAWMSSSEGQVFLNTLQGHYVALDADGSFAIDGVEPGDYTLAFRIYNAPEGSCLVSPVSTATFPLTVAQESETHLDLGTLDIDLFHELKPGDEVPDFEAATLDGQSVRLSDLRGRFVLLDFWATWCGPCKAELPNLRAAFDQFGDRVAFVGLNLDDSADVARHFVASESIGWPQAHLGDWAATDIPERFNVSAIPAVFLIDPDGRLVARELRGPALAEAIEKALEGTQK